MTELYAKSIVDENGKHEIVLFERGDNHTPVYFLSQDEASALCDSLKRSLRSDVITKVTGNITTVSMITKTY